MNPSAGQLGIKKTVFSVGRRGGWFIGRPYGSSFHTHGVSPSLVGCFSCPLTSPRKFEMYKSIHLFIRYETACRSIPGSVQVLSQMVFVSACDAMRYRDMPGCLVTSVRFTRSNYEGHLSSWAISLVMIDGMMIYVEDPTTRPVRSPRRCAPVCVCKPPKCCLQKNASQCLARADVT